MISSKSAFSGHCMRRSRSAHEGRVRDRCLGVSQSIKDGEHVTKRSVKIVSQSANLTTALSPLRTVDVPRNCFD